MTKGKKNIQSVDKAVQLLKMGAYTYLTKPLKIEEMHHNIKNALEKVLGPCFNIR